MGVPCWKVTVVFWGAAEILFFAGLVFGWASLVYILKDEGFFEESKGANGVTYNDKFNFGYAQMYLLICYAINEDCNCSFF